MKSGVAKIALGICICIVCILFAYINLKTVTTYNAPVLEYGEVTAFYVPGEITPSPAMKQNLFFVGDVMLARDVEQTLIGKGFDFPYKNLTFNSDTDYVFANFESAIPTIHTKTPNNTFRFSVDGRLLPSFRKAGFTHLSLANNHAFDFGLPGYNETITTLWEEGFVPFGHPTVFSSSSVTYVEVGTRRIALVALHVLFTEPKEEVLASVLKQTSLESDLQIVTVHWGVEYANTNSATQRKLAQTLSKLGVDIIVGHHPHVVQNIELIDNTLVFYSLGNFIFDQYFSVPVQQGLVLKLDSDLGIELLPVSSEEVRVQPAFMAKEKRKLFLESLSRRSDIRLVEDILMGKILYQNMLASSSEVAIMAE